MSKNTKIGANLIFIFWPFLNLLIGIKKFKFSYGRYMILLFFIMYGLSFLYAKAGDGSRHAEWFIEASNLSLHALIEQLSFYFSGKTSDITDVYTILVNFTISRFTSDPSVAFAFHAFVFGLFYLKSTYLLFQEFKPKYTNFNAYFFFLFFLSVSTIVDISFVRFYTAGWIFFYYSFLYLKEGYFKYVIGCFVPVLIHFALAPLFILVLLVKFIPFKNWLPFAFYLLTFFASISINLPDFAPEFLHSKSEIYSDEANIDRRLEHYESKVWYAKYQLTFLIWAIHAAVIYVFFNRLKSKSDNLQRLLSSLILILLGFMNIISDNFSASERYYKLIAIFLFAYLYRMFNINLNKQVSSIVIIALPSFLLWVVMTARRMIDQTSIFLFIGNPLTVLGLDYDVSIWDFIK